MTINQKINELNVIKDLLEYIETRKRWANESIKEKEAIIYDENGEEIEKKSWEINEIEDTKDRIFALEKVENWIADQYEVK